MAGLEPVDGRPELAVVGEVSASLSAYWQEAARIPIRWMGVIPQAEIPQVDRSAHVLFSADLNAACPNSVVEALACGLPVISFDTGALPEMVSGEAGRVVPYGADPWKLESLHFSLPGGREVLTDQERFRRGRGARRKAFHLKDVANISRCCTTGASTEPVFLPPVCLECAAPTNPCFVYDKIQGVAA